MGLEALAFKGGLAERIPGGLSASALRHDFPEALFDQGFQSRFLLLSDLPGLIKQTVWNMYGCLHMANHIISPSRRQAALFCFIIQDAQAGFWISPVTIQDR
jgi:hypothetical protein